MSEPTRVDNVQTYGHWSTVIAGICLRLVSYGLCSI